VKPTDFMRRNHMELIKHQRVETVRKGIRDSQDSLAGCVDCHVQFDSNNKAVPINAEGQFCSNCHEYLSVSLDCFQCHATVPDDAGKKDLAALEQAHLKPTLAMMSDTHQSTQEKGN
jgi:predicted CXXCH cytochrome family protein